MYWVILNVLLYHQLWLLRGLKRMHILNVLSISPNFVSQLVVGWMLAHHILSNIVINTWLKNDTIAITKLIRFRLSNRGRSCWIDNCWTVMICDYFHIVVIGLLCDNLVTHNYLATTFMLIIWLEEESWWGWLSQHDYVVVMLRCEADWIVNTAYHVLSMVLIIFYSIHHHCIIIVWYAVVGPVFVIELKFEAVLRLWIIWRSHGSIFRRLKRWQVTLGARCLLGIQARGNLLFYIGIAWLFSWSCLPMWLLPLRV